MTKLNPKYIVSYKGVYHRAGVPFEIDEADIQEMSRHGMIINDETEKTVENQTTEDDETEKDEEVTEETEETEEVPEEVTVNEQPTHARRGRKPKGE